MSGAIPNVDCTMQRRKRKPEAEGFRLQLVQNIAARLLSDTRKYEPVTPVLSALHWLPIKYRIDLKFCYC